jgi:hypothetical protein
MTITFRVKDETRTPVPALHITHLRAVALCRLMTEKALRLGEDMLYPIHGNLDCATYAFEARVCPVALAQLSRVFYDWPPAIALLDEAQFRRRRLRISRASRHADVIMEISTSHDFAPEVTMPNAGAYALLKTLGLSPDSYGAISLSTMRQRLTDPTIRGRLEADRVGLARYVYDLDRMVETETVSGHLTMAWT